jgi:hypothetical protein
MEKRFSRRYPFLVAVAACAVAAFLSVTDEICASSPRNLSATLFIYYNYMALNDPGKEKHLSWRGALCRSDKGRCFLCRGSVYSGE